MRLTSDEKKWLSDMQNLLDRCPSKRLGFYTIGDPAIAVYDLTKEAKIHEMLDNGQAADFCIAVSKADAGIAPNLIFPAPVHSTSG